MKLEKEQTSTKETKREEGLKGRMRKVVLHLNKQNGGVVIKNKKRNATNRMGWQHTY